MAGFEWHLFVANTIQVQNTSLCKGLLILLIIIYQVVMCNVTYFVPCKRQRAKKAVSDSPGLVDFATRLVIFVLNLPDGQVLFFEEEGFVINPGNQKGFWGQSK